MSRACPPASLCKDDGPEDRGEQLCKGDFLGLLTQLRLAGSFLSLGAVQDLGNVVVEPQSSWMGQTTSCSPLASRQSI